MRGAVSGSHSTGKSTLLADDVALTSSEGPSPDGLQALLDYTIAAVGRQGPDACVIQLSPLPARQITELMRLTEAQR